MTIIFLVWSIINGSLVILSHECEWIEDDKYLKQFLFEKNFFDTFFMSIVSNRE